MHSVCFISATPSPALPGFYNIITTYKMSMCYMVYTKLNVTFRNYYENFIYKSFSEVLHDVCTKW